MFRSYVGAKSSALSVATTADRWYGSASARCRVDTATETLAHGDPMQIRVGYELVYSCPQPTPMILTLSIHYSRVSDLAKPDHLVVQPAVPITAYRDSFGNWCSRIVAPEGRMLLTSDAVINDTGQPDLVAPWARQRPLQHLPEDSLVFLLGSRYCETDLLSQTAWNLFGAAPNGWGRVQAICDFVHQHITFGYEHASATKTAFQVYNEKKGVCRDYAHLAIAFCRCLNIPARYCTGYLGDIGLPPPYAPMDFAGWFEAYLEDGWYTFDPRNNAPRIGRVLIARGRDAADVAISTSFGPNTLESFRVWTDEVPAA
jgi:transglutaminase-like putative cysteine protease